VVLHNLKGYLEGHIVLDGLLLFVIPGALFSGTLCYGSDIELRLGTILAIWDTATRCQC
jgi:hypothetical protein